MMLHRTRLALFASLSGAALVLSGCGGLGGTEEAPPQEPAPVEQGDTDSDGGSDDGGSEGSGSDEGGDEGPEDTGSGGSDDGAAAGMDTADSDVAAPGTQVAVGESATVHVQALEEGEEHYGYATVSTTVTEIVEGDPAIIEQFDEDDQADLEGMTPWYVHAEHEILTLDGEPDANMTPRLDPQDAGGNDLTGAVAFGGSIDEECSVEGYEAKEAGATASTCAIVFTDGPAPAQVAWTGDDNADGYDSPYAEDPVVWLHEG